MPINPAGEEFAKLGQDVIAETGKVQQALENMLKSAGEADKAHDDLAKTQKDSGKIAKQYSDALKSVEEGMSSISKAGTEAAKQSNAVGSGLSSANRMSAGLSKSLSTLGRTSGAAQSGVTGVGIASREAAGMVSDLRREAELTSTALSNIKGEIDISAMSRSAREIEALAKNMSQIGLKLKVELDTSAIDSAAIDKFTDKVGASSDLKIKISADVSGLDTAAIDELAAKVKGITDVDVNVSPVKISIDTSDLDAARAAVDVFKDVAATLTTVVKQEVEYDGGQLVVAPNIKMEDFVGTVTAVITQAVTEPDGTTVKPNITLEDMEGIVKATVTQVVEVLPEHLTAKPNVTLEDFEGIVTAVIEQQVSELPPTTIKPNVSLEDMAGIVKAVIEQEVDFVGGALTIAPNVTLENFTGMVQAVVTQEVTEPDNVTVKPNVTLDNLQGVVTAVVTQVVEMTPVMLATEPNITLEDFESVVKATVTQVVEVLPEHLTVKPNITIEDMEGIVKATVTQVVELTPESIVASPQVAFDDLDDVVKVELQIDTTNIETTKAALEELNGFQITLNIDAAAGKESISEMSRSLSDIHDMSESVGRSTSFKAEIDTGSTMAALDEVQEQISSLQANARRMAKALAESGKAPRRREPVSQEVEITVGMMGDEDLQDSISWDATEIEREIEKSIFKLKELREVAKLSGASLEDLGKMDIEIAEAGIAKDFIDNVKDAAQAGMTLDSTIKMLEKDTGIWGLRMKEASKSAFDASKMDIVNKALDDQNKALRRMAKSAKLAGNSEITLKVKADLAQFEIIKDHLSDMATDAERSAAIVNGALDGIGLPPEVVSEIEKAKSVIFNEAQSKEFNKGLGRTIKKYQELGKTIKSKSKLLTSLDDKKILIETEVEIGELERFKHVLSDLEVPELKAKLEGMAPSDAKEYVKELSKMSDEQLEVVRTSANMNISLEDLRHTVNESATSLRNAAEAARESALSSSTLRGEIEAQGNAYDILIKKLNDGGQEAQQFAGGIGATEGKMIGAGVAAFFLLQKLGDLVENFKDARMELGEFNVTLAATERTTFGALPGEFDRVRDSLSLTREQAGQFFDVMKEGTNAGVASVAQLVAAGEQLREVFGGDQTDRLSDYVELLKEIPTLEADLQIGADLDDQAAAIFALAQQGKIETLVDLQAAGLAGGIQVEASDDVKLLNAAQSTDKTVQDIKDGMLTNFFPQWGPQFGAIAQNTFAALGLAGGAIAALGTLRIFLGSGTKVLGGKQDKTTNAINRMSDRLSDDLGDIGDGDDSDTARRITKGFKTALAREVGARLKGMKGNVFRRGTGRAATRIGARLGGLQGARAVAAGGGGAKGLIKALPQLTTTVMQTHGGFKGLARATGGLVKDSAGLAKSYVTGAAAAGNFAGKMSSAGGMITNAGSSVVKGFMNFGRSGAGIGIWATIAGIALDKFAGVVGDSTKDTGPALIKFTGGLLKAVGTIFGLATLGSSLGPVGTAMGAIAGVALVATGPIEDLGLALQQTTTDVNGVQFNRFSPRLVKAGVWLEALSGGVQAFVDTGLKVWTENIIGSGEAIKGAGIMLGELAMAIPGVTELVGVLSDAKKNLSEWYDGLEIITSVESRDVKKQEQEQSERLARKLGQLGKVTDQLAKLQAARQGDLIKSAQALEAQLGRTEAIFRGSTFALQDFNTELGQSNLDMLSEVGGNLAMFSTVVSSTTDALGKKISSVSKVLDRERAAILRNSGLNAAQREQALNDLHAREIEAVQDFARGIDDLVDKILDAPDTLIKKLNEEAAKADFDFSLEGGVSREELFAGSEERIKATGDIFDKTVDDLTQATTELARASAKAKSDSTEARKAVAEIFADDDISAGGKKLLKKAFETEEGAEGGVTVKGADVSGALEATQEINSQIADLKDEQATLTSQLQNINMNSIVDGFKKAQAATADADSNLEKWGKELKDTKSSLEDAVGDIDETTALEKKIANLTNKIAEENTRIAKAQQAQIDITAKINKFAKTHANNADEESLLLIHITKSRELTAEELKKANAITDRINEESKKQVNLLTGDVAENKKKLDEAVKIKSAIEAGSDSIALQVTAERQVLKLRQQLVDIAQNQSDAVNNIVNNLEATTKDEERRVQMAELQAAIASSTGAAIAETAKLEEANAKLAQEQFKAAQEAIPFLKKAIKVSEKTAEKNREKAKNARKEAEAAQEAAKAAKAALDVAKGDEAIAAAKKALENAKLTAKTQLENAETYDNAASKADTLADTTRNTAGDVARKGADAQKLILDSFTEMSDALDSFDSTLSGRAITAELDLGDALFAAAEFSEDFAKATSEAFAVTEKAAHREADIKRELALAGVKEAEHALAEQLKALRAAPTANTKAGQDAIKNTEQEGTQLILAKKRTQLANIEREQKEKVAAAAQKELDISNEDIDIRQEVIDAELDYLSAVGGNLDSFVALQNQAVVLEQERLSVIEKAAAAERRSSGDSLKTRRLEAQVIKQGFKLRQAEFGVQKDIFDKIIGGAFGEIRSSFGASRRRLTDVTLAGGAKKTEVVTRSGMLGAAGEGGTKTNEQRSNERKLAAANARANFARRGAGGVVDEAPTKDVEEQIFGEAKENRAVNEGIATDTGTMKDAQTKKGSIFTHDEGIWKRLDMLIDLQALTASGVGDFAGEASTESVKQAEQKIKDMRIQRGIKEQVEDSGTQQTRVAETEVKQTHETNMMAGQVKIDEEIKARNEDIKKLPQEKKEEGILKYLKTVAGAKDAGQDIGPYINTLVKTMEDSEIDFSPKIVNSLKAMGVKVSDENKTAEKALSGARFGRKLTTPEERAKGISKGIKMASGMSLTAGQGVGRGRGNALDGGGSASRFGGQSAKELAGKGGSLFGGGGASRFGGQTAAEIAGTGGSNFGGGGSSRFGSQTAKEIAKAATAARAGTTETMGRAVGTAAAQLASNDSFTKASGGTETRGAAIDRLKADEAEKNKMTDLGIGEDVVKELVTPFGNIQVKDAETRAATEEKLANEEVKRIADLRERFPDSPIDDSVSESKSNRFVMGEPEMDENRLADRFVVKMDGETDGSTTPRLTAGEEAKRTADLRSRFPNAPGESDGEKSNHFVMQMGDVAEDMALAVNPATGLNAAQQKEADLYRDVASIRPDSPDTTTGGESLALAQAESLTGAESTKGELGVPGAPGIAAKAQPNQEVVTDTTNSVSNESLAGKQQGLGNFDNNPRMQAAEMSNIGNARTGVSELPVMKIEGSLRIESNNAAFQGAIAEMVARVINTGEIANKLTPALKSRGFLHKDG